MLSKMQIKARSIRTPRKVVPTLNMTGQSGQNRRAIYVCSTLKHSKMFHLFGSGIQTSKLSVIDQALLNTKPPSLPLFSLSPSLLPPSISPFSVYFSLSFSPSLPLSHIKHTGGYWLLLLASGSDPRHSPGLYPGL